MAAHWHVNQRFNESAPQALATTESRDAAETELRMLRTALEALGWEVHSSDSNPTYTDLVMTWGTDSVSFCLWQCEAYEDSLVVVIIS